MGVNAIVSIVITSYNYGSYLSSAVESILCQSMQNFEIIIIDDGSIDNTRVVAESFLPDSRVNYIYQTNSGQPKAKNHGITRCSGEYIAFLDADDVWMPTKLEKQLSLFNDPEVGVVYSRRKWIDPQGVEIPGNERILRRGYILDHIFIDNFVCFSSSVVRRKLLQDTGYFDETLPMGIDYDLWIRLAARCKFDFVDEPLVKYRTGHANLSKNLWRRYECAQKIMHKSLQDPNIRDKFSRHVPGLAWADTWTNMGSYARKQGDRLKSARYLLKALENKPTHLPAWKELIKCAIYFDQQK